MLQPRAANLAGGRMCFPGRINGISLSDASRRWRTQRSLLRAHGGALRDAEEHSDGSCCLLQNHWLICESPHPHLV